MKKNAKIKITKLFELLNKIEARIHQSYQQEPDNKNDLKDKAFPQVPSSSSSVLTKHSNKLFQKENIKLEKISYQTNLAMALRRQIQDLKEDVRVKDEELLNIKRDIRNTKFHEFETENNILMNECVRLRAIVDQLFAQMNKTDDNPLETKSTPQRKDRSKDDMIQNLLRANEQFQKVDQEKDHKIMELQEQVQDLDSKLTKKSNMLQEAKRNHMKMIKTKNQEIQKLKTTTEAAPKDTPLNKSSDSKARDKESLTKIEKELQKVKSDLKVFKDNDKKLRATIADLENDKQAALDEVKELRWKISDFKTKIEILKKREESLEKAMEEQTMSRKESQYSAKQRDSEKAYESSKPPTEPADGRKSNDKSSKHSNQIKPIISYDSDHDDKHQAKNDNFELQLDSDDEKSGKHIESAHAADQAAESIHSNATNKQVEQYSHNGRDSEHQADDNYTDEQDEDQKQSEPKDNNSEYYDDQQEEHASEQHESGADDEINDKYVEDQSSKQQTHNDKQAEADNSRYWHAGHQLWQFCLNWLHCSRLMCSCFVLC